MVAMLELIRLWVAAKFSVLTSELLSIQNVYSRTVADKLQPSFSHRRYVAAHSLSRAEAIWEREKYYATYS